MPKTSRSTLTSELFHLQRVALATAVVVLACGCGDDKKRPMYIPRDGGDEDSGDQDAGRVDAGYDAGDPGFVLRGPCVGEAESVQTFVPREANPQPAPSLAARVNSFALTFAEQSACTDAVVVELLASNPRASQVRTTLDECTAVRNAVSIGSGSAWLTAWLDGRDDSLQVFATVIDPAFPPTPSVPPAPPTVRTPLSASADIKGSLVLGELSLDETLLVWTETDARGTRGAVKARILDTQDGTPVGDELALLVSADQVYTALALARIPTGGAVLGYVEGAGDRRSIFLQRLSATGEFVGPRALLSADGDRSSTVSIAMKDESVDHGAAVYSVNPAGARHGVLFQELDDEGMPLGQYRKLSDNLEFANGASITPSLSGFVVAYRALSDFDWEFGRIRVAFLGDVGNRLGDGAADIMEASDFGGAPAIASTIDGRIALSWFDDDEAGNRTLKLMRYPCNR